MIDVKREDIRALAQVFQDEYEAMVEREGGQLGTSSGKCRCDAVGPSSGGVQPDDDDDDVVEIVPNKK